MVAVTAAHRRNHETLLGMPLYVVEKSACIFLESLVARSSTCEQKPLDLRCWRQAVCSRRCVAWSTRGGQEGWGALSDEGRSQRRGMITSSSVAGASPLIDLAISRSSSLSCSALTAAAARMLASWISFRRFAAFSVRSR